MRSQTLARRLQRGLTLVECSAVAAVVCVLVGLAAPGFDGVRERRHLEGAAAQLETDILYTRSLAVAHNRGLRMSFQRDAAGSCYTVHSGPAQACSCAADGRSSCSNGDPALRSVHFPAAGSVQLEANVGSILFDPTRGTSTPTGTLRINGRSGRSLHLVVNLMGRVRSCSPDAAMPGLPRC